MNFSLSRRLLDHGSIKICRLLFHTTYNVNERLRTNAVALRSLKASKSSEDKHSKTFLDCCTVKVKVNGSFWIEKHFKLMAASYFQSSNLFSFFNRQATEETVEYFCWVSLQTSLLVRLGEMEDVEATFYLEPHPQCHHWVTLSKAFKDIIIAISFLPKISI